METMYLIIIFIFGTLMGSFLTVIGYRLPKKESFISTRSHCDSCGHVLKLYEMIPILSYLLNKGRCRYCHEKVSPLSTYNELFTGLLFALAYYIFGFSYELLMALGIISLFIIIIVSDIKYLIIPDQVLIFFSIYFILIEILNLGIMQTGKNIISGIILFLVMYLIMLIGNKILKKESLGGGDIKMMFIFGMIIKLLPGLFSIFLASIVALPISLIILIKKKENVIPFGPFLLLALIIIYFLQIDTLDILNFFKVI